MGDSVMEIREKTTFCMAWAVSDIFVCYFFSCSSLSSRKMLRISESDVGFLFLVFSFLLFEVYSLHF